MWEIRPLDHQVKYRIIVFRAWVWTSSICIMDELESISCECRRKTTISGIAESKQPAYGQT
jgi:hypothetical protein